MSVTKQHCALDQNSNSINEEDSTGLGENPNKKKDIVKQVTDLIRKGKPISAMEIMKNHIASKMTKTDVKLKLLRRMCVCSNSYLHKVISQQNDKKKDDTIAKRLDSTLGYIFEWQKILKNKICQMTTVDLE